MFETFKEAKKLPQKWGRIVEVAIGAHLINFAKTENYQVFYWRHVNKEVDFVLQYHDKIIGIEVKSGTTIHKRVWMYLIKCLTLTKFYLWEIVEFRGRNF